MIEREKLLLEQCFFITRGKFARAIVDRLGISADQKKEYSGVVYPASLPFATAFVMISNGFSHEDRDRVDSVAAVRRIPSVNLELTPTSLVCGPSVNPGITACYGCYARRREQHGFPVRSYANFPEGFGAEQELMGIGLLRLAVDDFNTAEKGSFAKERMISLPNGGMRVTNVVSVNNCPRCGGRYDTDAVSIEQLVGAGSH